MSAQTRRDSPVLAALSDQEARDAIEAAVQHLISETPNASEHRLRVLGAELLIEKPERMTSSPQRLIRVLIIDYTGKRILRFRIAPPDGVVRVEPVYGQPAFHRDEVDEARTIAERDDRLRHLTNQPDLFVSPAAPSIQIPEGTRVIELRYVIAEPDQHYRLVASVAVDLSEQVIITLNLYSHEEANDGQLG